MKNLLRYVHPNNRVFEQDSVTLIIGNAMAFAGIPAAKDRLDLIAYLKAS